jgi:hypothetical protein
MKHYFTSLILIIILGSFQSKASHYMGSEMTYTRVNASTINVKLKLYRDCSGIGLCGCPAGPLNTSCTVNVTLYGRTSTCNNTNFGTTALSIVPGAGVVDVIQLCSQAGATNCSNCGTKTPGSYNPAAEIYSFQGNISLASVPASCNTLAVGFSECCRSFSITSLQNPSSQNFYTELVFDKRFSNTSPSFINKPLAAVYALKDVYYNIGGFDPDVFPMDFFSLVCLVGNRMNLQGYKTLWCHVIDDVGAGNTIDPGSDAVADAFNFVMVPIPGFEGLLCCGVVLQWVEPSTPCFIINSATPGPCRRIYLSLIASYPVRNFVVGAFIGSDAPELYA